MAGSLGTDSNSPRIDSGTNVRAKSLVPGPANIMTMSTQDKVVEAIQRSMPLLPAEARYQVQALLSPEAIATMLATLLVWAGSHFFGVGEFIDIILLVAGFAILGRSAVEGGEALYNFAKISINARNDAELDKAAHYFARAVNILGIAIISALLLRSSAKSVLARGAPKVEPMPNVGTPPPVGKGRLISRPFKLPGGSLGQCDFFGRIQVIRNQIMSEQKITLYHEWVHSFLSPKTGPLQVLRAQLKASGYWRSSLLRYLEEAMAEGYAQLRVNGLEKMLIGVRFPIDGGYVTMSQLASEGIAIGNIILGGMNFTVFVADGDLPQP
jgi:hypothetical protein